MRHNHSIALAFVITASCFLSAIAAIKVAPYVALQSKLKITLSVDPKAKPNSTNIPVKVTFQNDGENSVKIVDYFKDEKALPTFFAFHIRKDDGTVVFVPGAGKISFARGQINCVELKKAQKFVVAINLADIIPPESKLKSGSYDVSVTYHNQYGEDCFKGTVKSDNSIKISIAE